MDKLLFGISGLPLGEGQKFDYAGGIAYLRALGLDAMELPFVRSVNVTEKNRAAVLAAKEAHGLYLSAHASYFINLNAAEPEKRDQSRARIVKAAEALRGVGGRSVVFHPGFYLGRSESDAYAAIRDNLRLLPSLGVDYRLETTGKASQFGSLEEIVALCGEIGTCKPCIDFSHLHARDGGALKSRDDFSRILDHVGERLGPEALADLHIHISGIAYGPKGEKNHLPLLESDFDYKACLKALHGHGAKGCVVCESPELENDALLLKNFYESL
ncbi:TIM barrel protein [Solidesulfovibrio sp.]|uniref:TIM barrel protein n=1 Tax=Solidesulfovibrio sp. TaxID=2910990 RepID=UPI00261C9F2C|nr:TIM barrel protein [Solidesulfovibrio sp.]